MKAAFPRLIIALSFCLLPIWASTAAEQDDPLTKIWSALQASVGCRSGYLVDQRDPDKPYRLIETRAWGRPRELGLTTFAYVSTDGRLSTYGTTDKIKMGAVTSVDVRPGGGPIGGLSKLTIACNETCVTRSVCRDDGCAAASWADEVSLRASSSDLIVCDAQTARNVGFLIAALKKQVYGGPDVAVNEQK